MSGGSYGYLCFQEIGTIINSKRLLVEMLNRLAEINVDSKAYRDTANLLQLIERLENEIVTDSLRNVWQAIEWEKSGDYGTSQLEQIIVEYESE